MFEAQYIITDDADDGIKIFSPWFPRQGDRILYTIDVVEAVDANITVELITKNTEDAGDGSGTGNVIGPTSTVGRDFSEFDDGLLELVRYQYTVKAASDGRPGWVAFRMLSPVWFDAVSTT